MGILSVVLGAVFVFFVIYWLRSGPFQKFETKTKRTRLHHFVYVETVDQPLGLDHIVSQVETKLNGLGITHQGVLIQGEWLNGRFGSKSMKMGVTVLESDVVKITDQCPELSYAIVQPQKMDTFRMPVRTKWAVRMAWNKFYRVLENRGVSTWVFSIVFLEGEIVFMVPLNVGNGI